MWPFLFLILTKFPNFFSKRAISESFQYFSDSPKEDFLVYALNNSTQSTLPCLEWCFTEQNKLGDFLIPIVDLYCSFLLRDSLFGLQVGASSFKFLSGWKTKIWVMEHVIQ